MSYFFVGALWGFVFAFLSSKTFSINDASKKILVSMGFIDNTFFDSYEESYEESCEDEFFDNESFDNESYDTNNELKIRSDSELDESDLDESDLDESEEEIEFGNHFNDQ